MKIGRNQPCPCNSGRKFKHCHGSFGARPDGSLSDVEFQRMLERNRADERIRREQQGLGKPIISFRSNDHQIVAVGNVVHFSTTWKTFPDFLADYTKRVLDPAWGNVELAKPFAERHPAMQWYETYCRYQLATIKTPGVTSQAIVTGNVACYLGLAYNLYLLAHNVELQKRLVDRLMVAEQFQGAYYELVVAGILIRAGFELELEDEADGASKHCEFSARSRRTGKKYWVEAKMRSVAGLFGKTTADGTTNPNPLNRLIPQLNDALAKPAADERLIFIDLNAEMTADSDGKPVWIEQAARRLERYEREDLPAGTVAYVFVTNFAFHRYLHDPAVFAGFFLGLGIPDLNRPGVRRVTDAYRTKQKHIDVFHIGDAIQSYGRFPTTFDGSLPSEAMGGPSRVIVGNTYCFGDPANGGVIGTVTYASVNEVDNSANIGIVDQNGNASIIREPMTPAQLEDWRAHKDSYFGKVLPVGKKVNNAFELFEWLVEQYREMPRDKMLAWFARAPHIETIRAMSDEDLLYYYCECLVAATPGNTPQSQPPSVSQHGAGR
jgi:hypothetical protein